MSQTDEDFRKLELAYFCQRWLVQHRLVRTELDRDILATSWTSGRDSENEICQVYHHFFNSRGKPSRNVVDAYGEKSWVYLVLKIRQGSLGMYDLIPFLALVSKDEKVSDHELMIVGQELLME